MSNDGREHEDLLESAVSELRDAQPDATSEAGALSRVGRRLAAKMAQRELAGCADYRAILPELDAGTLSGPRRMLLEDHLSECPACRRARMERRRPAAPVRDAGPRRALPIPAWALSAAAVLVLGVSTAWLTQGWLPAGLVDPARLSVVEGTLVRVAGPASEAAVAGAALRPGERLRTAGGAGAIVALPDGSRVELAEHSELSWHSGWRNTTLELSGGQIIVEASPQRLGRLFVRTDDCTVEVKGTVFSVTSATKGSRVSVLEGEVRVDRAGDTSVLLAGDQLTTSERMSRVPLDVEVAWSRNFDEHLALMRELFALGRELERVPRPGLRYESELMEYVPDSAALVAAIPNLGETVAGSWTVLRDEVATSEVLDDWWRQNVAETGLESELERAVVRVRELGDLLGNEIVLALGEPAFDGPPPLVILAASRDDEALERFVLREAGSLDELEDVGAGLTLLRGPLAAPTADASAGEERERLLLWIHEGLVVAGFERAQIDRVRETRAGASPSFSGTRLWQRMRERYADGAGWLIAADVHRLMASARRDVDPSGLVLDRLGLLAARDVIAERRRVGERDVNQATVYFDGPRSALAAAIAEPAPLGALDFISPEAHVAAALALEQPVDLLREVLAGLEDSEASRALEEFREETGLDLLDDVARPLGGEVAFALDGPVLPSPAWRLIVETWDEAALQHSIDRLLARVNDERGRAGLEPLSIVATVASGRKVRSLVVPGSLATLHWTFDGGYMIAAPEPALIARAIATRDSGYSLQDSPRFRELLPDDGPDNFSALVYQNAGSLIGPLARLGRAAPVLSPEQQRMLEELAREQRASLTLAWAGPDSIAFVNAGGGPLGGEFGTLLGLGGFALDPVPPEDAGAAIEAIRPAEQPAGGGATTDER